MRRTLCAAATILLMSVAGASSSRADMVGAVAGAGTGLVVAYACTIFYLVTLMWMLPREERELRARFGETYGEYVRRVPSLIPRLF